MYDHVYLAYNGGKKNLGLCEKPFQAIFTSHPAPKDNFLFGFGFIPSSPTFPSNVVTKKTLIFTHFAPNSTLFEVGGEGSLVLLISLERSPINQREKQTDKQKKKTQGNVHIGDL